MWLESGIAVAVATGSALKRKKKKKKKKKKKSIILGNSRKLLRLDHWEIGEQEPNEAEEA